MNSLWLLTVVLALHAHNSFCNPAYGHKDSYEVGSHANYGNAYGDHDGYQSRDSYGGFKHASLDSIKPHSSSDHDYKSYKDDHYDSYNSHQSKSHSGYIGDDHSYRGHSYPSYKRNSYDDHSYDSKPHSGYAHNDHSYGGHSYPSYKSHSNDYHSYDSKTHSGYSHTDVSYPSYKSHSYDKHSPKSYNSISYVPSEVSRGYGNYREPHSYGGYAHKGYKQDHSHSGQKYNAHSNSGYSPKSYGRHEQHTYDSHAAPHSYTGYSGGAYRDGHSLPPLISDALGEIVDASRSAVETLAESANTKIAARGTIIKEVLDGVTLGITDGGTAVDVASAIHHRLVDTVAGATDRSLEIAGDVVTELEEKE